LIFAVVFCRQYQCRGLAGVTVPAMTYDILTIEWDIKLLTHLLTWYLALGLW